MVHTGSMQAAMQGEFGSIHVRALHFLRGLPSPVPLTHTQMLLIRQHGCNILHSRSKSLDMLQACVWIAWWFWQEVLREGAVSGNKQSGDQQSGQSSEHASSGPPPASAGEMC